MSALPRRDRLADILSGGHPLVWATATLAADPPDKAQAGQNGATERLMWPGVARAVEAAKSEVIIVSPYLVPGEEEMALLRRLRERGVRVRVLTNSLASTDMPIAHAGYLHHRVALLEAGCELFEVRPVPGAPEAHGLVRSGASGQFGLHAKLIVIDGERSYVGSMNFDRRSLDINTEIGLLIDSPEIANALTRRIEAILAPTNSYRLALDRDALGATRVEWITEDDGGRMVRLDDEPDVDPAKNALIRMLSLLPIQDLL